MLGQQDILMEIVKINLISHCHIVINLKWITYLNVKGKTIKLLEKKNERKPMRPWDKQISQLEYKTQAIKKK